MPDAKITDLGDGGLPQDTDDFVVARGVTNNKLAWSSLAAAATVGNVAVTLDGNTAGALADISSGTMTLAGGNNITLSQAGNAITISGPNVAGAQTGISGIQASDATYTSGTVIFTGSNAATVLSGTGQRVIIDVPVQSVQPETQTFIAGISASDTLYTSGNVRFTGVGGGVTVSSNTGQRVDISVAAQSVQPETQTFIAGISASDTLYTSGNVRFTGVGGGITVSSNTGQRVDLSVAAQSVQPETQTFIGGISASDTLYTSGSVRFTGSQAVTVRSGTGQLVVIDAPAQTTQTQGILSVGVSTGGNTAGNTQVSTGSRFVIVASGNATASQATAAGASTITISVGTQTVQTQGILSAGVSTGGNTAGNTQVSTGSRLVIVGSNGITASQGTAAGATTITLSGITQTVQTQGILSAGVSTGGNTAGNTQVSTGSRFVLVGSGNLTASQGTAAGATTVTLSVAAQSVQPETQTFIGGISASDTLYTSGSVRFTGVGGGVTVSSNTGQRVDISVAAPVAQTVQTQGILNVALSNIGNTAGDTGINSGTRMVLAGGNNITLSASSAAGATTITISAPNLGAGAMSAGVSNLGNTAGSTGVTGTRLVLVGTNNITLSQSTDANGGTVSISGPAAGGFSAGMSTEGNTAGNTGVTGTRLVLVGSGPISLSQTTGAAGGTLSINAPATSSLSATGAVSISTNGSTISIGAPVSSLSATGGIQISSNGSTISIGDGGRTMANWENMPAMEGVLYTHISGVSKTPFYWNENLPQGIRPANIAMRFSMVTANSDLSLSIHFGIYTFVNSTSVALLGSGSDAFVVSSASSVSFSAQRNLVLTSPGTNTAISSLSAGNYLFGAMFSATATNAMNASIYAASAAAGPRLGRIMPGTNQLSTATSQGIAGLYGRGSTTVNALPANVVASEVVNQGIGASSPMKPYIFIRS